MEIKSNVLRPVKIKENAKITEISRDLCTSCHAVFWEVVDVFHFICVLCYACMLIAKNDKML